LSSKNIVIFASGSGSSAENIILSFKKTPAINVTKLYCNKPDALVLQRIKKHNIESLLFNSIELNNNTVLENLTRTSPDLIVKEGSFKKYLKKLSML
jgi:Folate-dependent phosphoribosylglycinamide formyltransferase PurN